MAKPVEETDSEYLEHKAELGRIFLQAGNVGFSYALMYEIESVLGKVSEDTLLSYALKEVTQYFKDMRRRCDDYEHLKRIRFNVSLMLELANQDVHTEGDSEEETGQLKYSILHGV